MLVRASILFLPLVAFSASNNTLELRAVRLLSERYETVVSARSTVLSRLHFDHPDQEFGRMYLGLPFVYLIGALQAVGSKALGTLERSSESVLTGAKDFSPPKGTGMATSRVCYIAIVAPGSAATLALEFARLRREELRGMQVWTWSLPPSEGNNVNTKFYAAFVGDFFLLGNSEEDFRDLANSIAGSTAGADVSHDDDFSALLHHAYWAYRTIRRFTGGEALGLGLRGLPVSATGLQLFTEFDDHKTIFNVLTASDHSESVRVELPSSKTMLFLKARAGVWQAVISSATDDPDAEREVTSAIFQVLSYFGYVVVL